jgi:hypothetical protein
MHKVKIRIDYDYLRGHLRCAHQEGDIELTDEEFEALKKDPIQTVIDLELDADLEFEIDDYEIDDSSIGEVRWSEEMDLGGVSYGS